MLTPELGKVLLWHPNRVLNVTSAKAAMSGKGLLGLRLEGTKMQKKSTVFCFHE